MLFKNRKSYILNFALILALLGGLFGMIRVRPVHAAMLTQINTNNSAPQGDLSFPTVVTTSPQQGDVLSAGVSTVSVQFSTAMLADGTAFAVNKTSNYLLVEDGLDGKFQTTSCAGNLGGDDTKVNVNAVTYNATSYISALSINSGISVSAGSYQLLICGSTRINDLSGNKLNEGADSVIRFLVVIIEDNGFGPYTTYSAGGFYGHGAGIGDLNDDGFNDVAMTTDNQVVVYLQNNSGGLNTPVAYAAGAGPRAVVIDDLNNDGMDDIVTGETYSNTISVFLQQPGGVLANRVTYATLKAPSGIALGDVNGDQLTDIVVAPSVGVFTQNVDGSFNPMVNYPSPEAGPYDITIGDVNNDGRNDVVKMNGTGINPHLAVYLQNVDGTLASEVSYSLGCNCVGHGIGVGDVTGDGLSDVVMSYGGNRPSSKVAVFAQGANGLLQAPLSYNAYDIPSPIELADVNLDGALDVLTLNAGWSNLSVFLQESGILSPYTLYSIPTVSHPHPQALVVGDINEDGAIDVAFANYNSGLIVLYHHVMPMPQIVMGGNASPLDGEELGESVNQLVVQFNREMRADGGIAAANNISNYLLVEGGADNAFQTTSCTAGISGDDININIDNINYNASKQYATLSVNMGALLVTGKYRLLVCSTVAIQEAAGIQINKGLSDSTITFTVWPAPYTISGNAGIPGSTLSYVDGTSKTAIADGSGDYFFKVSENWSGTVTPSKAGYTFSPASKTYANILSDKMGEDYTVAPTTYTISGNVGISDVSVTYSSNYDGSYFVKSDIDGNYSITVPYGWWGHISPHHRDYTFSPDGRDYVSVFGDMANEDYVAIPNPYTISGNTGVAGVSVSYKLNGTNEMVTSDQSGSYSFTVPENWIGTVTPYKPNYRFTPANRSFSNVQIDQTAQDFIAQRLFTISGNAGVAWGALSYTDETSKTIYASSLGNYAFQVPEHWYGTVTPTRPGYAFSPTSLEYADVIADQINQDYVANTVRITLSGKAGTAGVTLSYIDGGAKTVVSDINGEYSFTVPYYWSGTVTPSKSNYRFTPINRSYSYLQTDQLDQNFVAERVYIISGNVGIGGATLNYVDGISRSVTADSNGNYSLQVPENWSGTIAPSKLNYIFAPASRNYSMVQLDQGAQDYVATSLYSISGNVGVAGAILNYVEDGTEKSVTASGDGSYSFKVKAGWSGTVTPAKTGTTFTPANKTYIDVLANHTGSNYVANITVITTVDGGAGSLRQAINDAVSGATIHFDPTLAGQSINLVSTLTFNKDLSINGSGLNPRVKISGGGAVRIFDFGRSGGNSTLESLILENGKVTGTNNGGAIIARGGVITIRDVSFLGNSAYDGGAIYSSLNNVDLRISQSDFYSNSAQHYGGAIYINNGDFSIQNSILNDNAANSIGGAILADGGPFSFENNSFAGNTATNNGGAIALMDRGGPIIIRGNLFSNNTASFYYGGAISDALPFSSSSLSIENNTFYNNSANNAGAVIVSHTVSLKNNTFSNNKATQASSDTTVASIYLSRPLNATLYNNVLANNTGGKECVLNGSGMTTINGSNNLVEDGSGPCSTLPGAIIADPQLGPLADNGGSTQTMALIAGSPAINAGDNANCPATDQRGIARPQIEHCDIGAYEFESPVMSPGETARVSLNSNGAQVLAESVFSEISANGRYVVFESNSPNLAPGDTNGTTDIFLRDLQTGLTKLVSVNSSGVQGNNYATNASISADGRYIAFHSIATNLVSSDTNGWSDIFVHDTQTGVTTRASVSSDGTQANEASFSTSISADGRYTAFVSRATNLVAGDTNVAEDVFVHDTQTGITTRVSVASNGSQANKLSSDSSISADGRYVTFYSYARNLVTGDTNGKQDIFIHDQQSGVTTRVSVDSNGAQANGTSLRPSFSADGRYIIFESAATNLVAGDTNAKYDIFLRDLQTGIVTRVSVDSNGLQGNNYSDYASISADGRYIVFNSGSTNLVSGDTNGWQDIFVRDIQLGTTTRVSVASDGIPGNNYSYSPSISGDGQYIVFASSASNLITGDTNGLTDIFVRRQSILPPPPVTPTSTPTVTGTPSRTPTPTHTPTPTNTSTSGTPPLYLSLLNNQTVGGVASADEDILRFDGMIWSLFFDGSDVGVGGLDLFGFSIVDADTILMSFNNPITLGGLAIAPQDIVRFDATSLGMNTSGTFSMYLNGIDVGLDASAEKIDSVSLLEDGRVLISTTGNPSVTGLTGLADEDVLAFTPATLGNNTSGSWALYFDGSDVGLSTTSDEDIDALDVVDGNIYLSTLGDFAVTGVSGFDEDVFVCMPTSTGSSTACNFSSVLYFDGSTWGLTANDVDAFNFISSGTTPTATQTPGGPAITPTRTPTITPTFTRTSTPTATSTSGSQPLPDLTITNMRIELQNTSCLAPGDTMGVRVWFTNNGQAAAGIFLVNVNGAEQIVNGLAVGEIKAVFFSGYSNPVNAVVDSTNMIIENNKSNNARSETLPVPTQPLPCATPTHTLTPAVTFTPTFTNTPPSGSDLIFADGFESGNLSAWTSSAINGGDLSVSALAALNGNQGLQALINDNNTISVTDDSPNAEPRYRVRFYFDPNSIPMVSGDAHFIFKAFMGTSTEVVRLEFRQSAGAYQIRQGAFQNDSSWVYNNWITISDAPHSIELDWFAATTSGPSNGSLSLWIDGTGQGTLVGVDNSGRWIDSARLGALTGLDNGTRGTYYFDAFESRRQTYIGP